MMAPALAAARERKTRMKQAARERAAYARHCRILRAAAMRTANNLVQKGMEWPSKEDTVPPREMAPAPAAREQSHNATRADIDAVTTDATTSAVSGTREQRKGSRQLASPPIFLSPGGCYTAAAMAALGLFRSYRANELGEEAELLQVDNDLAV